MVKPEKEQKEKVGNQNVDERTVEEVVEGLLKVNFNEDKLSTTHVKDIGESNRQSTEVHTSMNGTTLDGN